jgi:hypothetical protein
MKLFSYVTLAVWLMFSGSLCHARGAPTSSFAPRTAHQDRATLSHKHNPKAAHSGARRTHYAPRTPPPK